MSMNGVCDLEVGDWAPKRARLMVTPTLGFSEEDREGTLQPHDDALVVTIRTEDILRRIVVPYKIT